jgi:hypothetical protein
MDRYSLRRKLVQPEQPTSTSSPDSSPGTLANDDLWKLMVEFSLLSDGYAIYLTFTHLTRGYVLKLSGKLSTAQCRDLLQILRYYPWSTSTSRLRKRGYAANCLGLVHDAINFEVRNDQVADVLPIIKDTMEDMSIVRKKFGVVLDVPIIADLKVGQHWGDAEEITPDQVYDWKGHSAA